MYLPEIKRTWNDDAGGTGSTQVEISIYLTEMKFSLNDNAVGTGLTVQ